MWVPLLGAKTLDSPADTDLVKGTEDLQTDEVIKRQVVQHASVYFSL